MTIISLIAAVDENRGLGKNNQLLCHLPADLAHFKKITMGKPIIMGRKTFASIGRPLPGRLNIVLSRTESKIPDVVTVSSLSQALEQVSEFPEAMIIGGAELFEQALPLATRLYLTVIHHLFDADVFFPSWKENEWSCLEMLSRQADEKNPYDVTFYSYERR
ncbi:dihydrofolate reductase FolA [Legionella rubrilucens]|uniref:Dihydrofolate reductase n=1 Tax=Legionella rubrilucens TaxID=458 RepID=A0A0W0XM86_9GAMM|nr:dihydrofolate reductase [Legionella rubrilucens]KTD45717.1 dihydrofolate reductase FolA [Legionella rubrilucens]